MKALFRRELKALVKNGTLWLFLAVALAGTGVSTYVTCVAQGTPAFAGNGLYMALAMALACGLASMNAFPSERKQNTERLLYALPLSTASVAMAKLAARWAAVLIAGALTAAYPVVLNRVCPSVALRESLCVVAAVTAMGFMFMSVGVFCSACSKYALTALLAYTALVALAYVMPLAAERVVRMTSVDIVTLAIALAIVVLLVYCVTGDWLISCFAGAALEVPALICCLRGNDAAVTAAVAKAMKGVSVFEGLTPFVNGLMDVTGLLIWLLIAALFAVLCVTAAAGRRHGKRRAL